MKKRTHLLLILTNLGLLTAAWTWRYVTMNRYYDSLDNSNYRLYTAGEEVPFEDDGNDFYTDLNGYYIRVDGYRVVDYSTYLAENNISIDNETPPEKLALVQITLINKTCEANPIMLTNMLLHSTDTVIPMDWDVLVKANSILKGNTGISLSRGTECQLILPYQLSKSQFEGSTWRRIEDRKVYLQVTNVLTTKEIVINKP